jgi:DNA invertase Pin-like site-specific DNA recombinase
MGRVMPLRCRGVGERGHGHCKKPDGAFGISSSAYREKASGAKTDWPELAKLPRKLEPGDVVLVTRLDRLARSTRDVLNVLASITERGAGSRSL